jgi:predicted CopG family antitoxin
MATKTITVTDEAYERLKEHKREDESFTDTILRLTGSDRDLMKGFGSMSDVEGFREAVEDTRDDLDTDLRERARR